MPAKIWHQSIADLSALPGYADTLAARAATLVTPGTQVDVHGVSPGTYPSGVDPVEALRYPWVRDLKKAMTPSPSRASTIQASTRPEAPSTSPS